MRQDLTDITVVLDRSGSMETVRADTIGGFNTFLKEQQAQPGGANLTLVQFDDQYDTVYAAKPIKAAPELTAQTFVPRGMTALLDAIGRAINDTGKRLGDMSEADRPGKVIFVILTDGEENHSREFGLDKITEMIEHQRDKYNWLFVFLGANQDAIKAAAGMGIGSGQAMSFMANSQGVKCAFSATSRHMSNYRGPQGPTGPIGDNFDFYDAKDRKDQVDAGVISSTPPMKSKVTQ